MRTFPEFAIRVSIICMLWACAPRWSAPHAWAQESSTPAGGAAAASAPAAASGSATDEAVEIAVPLLERSPFDRITLDAANQNAVIETVVLDLPNRQLPNPLPTTGSLDIRRLSHPSIPYTVQWAAITKVELFEQMLLAEAERLTAEGKFGDAFDYLAFLTANYPQLPGLEQALQTHLWREASASYAAKKHAEAWPALVALYERNANYPRLVNAVQAVSDDLIARRLQDRDYAAARTLVEALSRSFPKLNLANVARWQGQFQSDAEAQLTRARKAFAAKDYGEARDAIAFARSIMPDIPGGVELWKEIQATAPEIRVGVTQPAPPGVMSQTPTWAAARVSDLVNPRLVEMVDFGAEGGVYASRWSDLKASDDGLRTAITLKPLAVERGLRASTLALRLVEMASLQGDRAQADFAALTAGVQLTNGRGVEIVWRRPHVRPEAFLQIPLRWLATASEAPGLWFDPQPTKRDGVEHPFERSSPPSTAAGEPRLVVEMQYPDDESMLDALMRNDVDAIDRVPPWQLASVENAATVSVVPYRLPTVHVLIPNPANPLLEVREFRRALNYGIDAESIVRDIILGGETRAGFRTLSGPFPAGVTLNDPGGYAYNPEVAPRPYEPRLAALLAGVARTTLAKREEEKKKAEAEAKAKAAAASEPPTTEGDAAKKPAASSDAPAAETPAPPPAPLILAHAADPVARLSCQTIKLQLDLIGIPIKLAEFKSSAPPAELKYDLLYAELAVWEPVYDARRLLGATGVAGRASAMMAAALDQLDRAENWNQARDQLREIHRIAHYDLPLIPLWQTVNHFAHRKSLSGIGASPVTLYQNLADWRKSIE
ncbi:MAG: hypothetical protein JNL18_14095 [Planctomycetaceae bacterium]|nr:hypothetical protein [Planctomycetaceae bacterium]